jgi:hypothetical protein
MRVVAYGMLMTFLFGVKVKGRDALLAKPAFERAEEKNKGFTGVFGMAPDAFPD